MTQDMVETFLMILKYRNITAAAQSLYTSQSTVSHRLRLLEQEVGAQLFVRQKGHRTVEPTQAGEDFVELAERWMTLFHEMGRIEANTTRQNLSIGAPDLINAYTFAPLYQKLLVSHPELRLFIRTYHSGELYRLMETRDIELGYVYSLRRFQDVIATPLYREPMYVICHKASAFHPAMEPGELQAEQEVYLRWSADYELWHDRFWPSDKSLITVSMGDQMPLYLDTPGRWAIVPASVYQTLRNSQSLACYTLTESPPYLCCYEIRHRYPRQSMEGQVELLRQEVRAFVRSSETLLQA